MTTITCFLKRGQESQEIELKLTLKSPRKMLKAMRKLRKAEKEGWQLVDAKGDDPRIVDYIKAQITSYAQDPSGYKVPIKKTLTLGAHIAKSQGALRRTKKPKK